MKISCVINSLTFSSSPPSTNSVKIGIDSQPYPISYALVKFPLCTQNPKFTLSLPTQTFVSNSVNADNVSGNISVSGATLANIGNYPYILSAKVDSVSI